MKTLAFFCLVAPALAIWPVPISYTNGSTALWIDEQIKVSYNGRPLSTGLSKRSNDSSPLNSYEVVKAGTQRALDTIFTEHFIPWKLHPRNQLSAYEPSKNCTAHVHSLKLVQTGNDTSATFKPLAGQVDEAYDLTLTVNGTATISATSSIGILRGLDTFTQLFYTHSSGTGIYTNLAPISIKDEPQFAHRGVALDVSRNWYTVADIQRTIDAAAWNKFNVMHLHITDSQSWPLEIPALPELAQKGAYQQGLAYSPQDLESIQSYGAYRGVEVILEIDMPGHSGAVALAYPDLVTAYNAEPWATYCAEPPCGQLKLNNSAVNEYVDTLMSDVLPRVAPYAAYFHTGGDEFNANDYLLDPDLQTNDTTVLQPLLQQFVDLAHGKVRDAGLTPMAWEEMLVQWNLTLGDDVVVHSWASIPGSLDTITALGHKAIASDYNYWYLDCGKGQWLDFSPESYATYYPFNDWCGPVKNWKLVYSFNPTAGLSEAQAKLVLGGEVFLWSEQTDGVNLDDMLWPRASAAGEVLWSGNLDAQGQNRTQLDASPRLNEMRERLVARGIRAGPVQMVFCSQFDATECSL